MDLIFPYEYQRETKFGAIYIPVIKVSFKVKGDNWLNIGMIVDTGADHTIIPRYLSKELNIDLEQGCDKDVTLGVGGQTQMFMLKEKYPVKIGRWQREIPLGILDSDDIPPLMGRLGFLESFECLFTKNFKLRISQ